MIFRELCSERTSSLRKLILPQQSRWSQHEDMLREAESQLNLSSLTVFLLSLPSPSHSPFIVPYIIGRINSICRRNRKLILGPEPLIHWLYTSLFQLLLTEVKCQSLLYKSNKPYPPNLQPQVIKIYIYI